jgi:hypothetical protein
MCVTCSETAKRRVMTAWLLRAGTSEGWNLAYVDDWEGGLNLASTINLNWVTQNQTAMIVWNLIYSFYSILPFAHPDDRDPVAGMGHGLMTAAEPWSGHYRLQPPLYAMMHTTQFTKPGACQYIDSSSTRGHGYGHGFLDQANASTIVVFLCEGEPPWITVVVETSGINETLADVTLQFRDLPGRFATAGFDVWRTCEHEMFTKLGTVRHGGPDKHDLSVNVTFLPHCIYTLVSTGANRGAPIPSLPIKASRSFPARWTDNFENYTDQQTVRYFTDQSGSFNAARPPTTSAGAGKGGRMVLQQAVPEHPINGAWWGNSEPYTLIGNSQHWTNITVEVDAMIAPGGGHTQQAVGGYIPLSGALAAGHDLAVANLSWADAAQRCNFTAGCVGFTFRSSTPRPTEPVHVYFKSSTGANSDAGWHSWLRAGGAAADDDIPCGSFVRACARISTFKPNGEPPQGYCLIVDCQAKWFLTLAGKAVGDRDAPIVLKSGQLAGTPRSYVGSWHRLRLDVRGTTVTGWVDGIQVGSVQNGTLTHGMAAIGSGWHVAFFDNFTVNATTTTPMLR